MNAIGWHCRVDVEILDDDAGVNYVLEVRAWNNGVGGHELNSPPEIQVKEVALRLPVEHHPQSSECHHTRWFDVLIRGKKIDCEAIARKFESQIREAFESHIADGAPVEVLA